MTDPDLPVSQPVSSRSRGVALGLAVVGGVFGLHRFYLGKVGTGLGMLFTLGGFGIWYLYDVVLLAVGEFRDIEDRRVLNWGVEADLPGSAIAGRHGIAELETRVDALQRELGDLAERMDFAERMLAQQRERGSLPKG